MTVKDEILSVTEAGQILGVGSKRVRQLIADGQLPAKLLGRQWAVLRSDVEELKRAREEAGKQK